MDAIQKTAIIETAKTIGAITGIVFVVSAAISLLSLSVIAGILMTYCIIMAVKMIYDMQLNRAQVKQMEIDAEIDRLHK